ncbi:hypothetical protein SAMN04487913_12017 [Arthrobacter sp. ok362]|nr:hypothetical protein SAMN04487913_12017 [Arthrobacter sp. ok362]
MAAFSLPVGKQSLWFEAAVVDRIPGMITGAHHGTVLDGDVTGAAIAAQYTRGLPPAVHRVFSAAAVERLIHTDRPQAGHTAFLSPGYWLSGQP